jgi:hypothetical protein
MKAIERAQQVQIGIEAAADVITRSRLLKIRVNAINSGMVETKPSSSWAGRISPPLPGPMTASTDGSDLPQSIFEWRDVIPSITQLREL